MIIDDERVKTALKLLRRSLCIKVAQFRKNWTYSSSRQAWIQDSVIQDQDQDQDPERQDQDRDQDSSAQDQDQDQDPDRQDKISDAQNGDHSLHTQQMWHKARHKEHQATQYTALL